MQGAGATWPWPRSLPSSCCAMPYCHLSPQWWQCVKIRHQVCVSIGPSRSTHQCLNKATLTWRRSVGSTHVIFFWLLCWFSSRSPLALDIPVGQPSGHCRCRKGAMRAAVMWPKETEGLCGTPSSKHKQYRVVMLTQRWIGSKLGRPCLHCRTHQQLPRSQPPRQR